MGPVEGGRAVPVPVQLRHQRQRFLLTAAPLCHQPDSLPDMTQTQVIQANSVEFELLTQN